jgi:hypothetical protein
MIMAYTDETKALALTVLQQMGGNYEKTSQWLAEQANIEISSKQISRWDKGIAIEPEIVEKVEEIKKRDLADCLEKLAFTLIDAAPGKIPDAPLSQVMVGVGIAVDKMRLQRGEATSISQHNMSDDERATRVEEILNKAKERREGYAGK